MKLKTLDFETYYDKAYSLNKLTTEEYIKDSRFEVIGVAIDKRWFSGSKEEIKRILLQHELHEYAVCAHNARFDMAILKWHFGISPKFIFDTLSMARAVVGTKSSCSLSALAKYFKLGVKGTEVLNALGKRRFDFSQEELSSYGEYCVNDVALTAQLLDELGAYFNKDELKLIDLTIRMFTEPTLQLDVNVLNTHLENVVRNKESLMERCGVGKKELNSNPKFAELLMNLGVDPPMKISPSTGLETYAFAKTDEEFKELLEHENEDVQALVAARLGVKTTLEETRTARFIKMAERGDMAIPLNYYGAHTGRWSGADKVNFQNLSNNSLIKRAMVAPPGYLLVNCDSSQIEARILAWFASQDDLVTAFRNKEDVYKIMASSIFRKLVEEIDAEERQVGKVVILGSGYGLGWKKLMRFLKNKAGVTVNEVEAGRIIDIYRLTYSKIPALWKQGDKVLIAIANNSTVSFGKDGVVSVEGEDGIRLPNGLYLSYPNLEMTEDGWTYEVCKGNGYKIKYTWGGSIVENVIQALARIVVGEQMLKIASKHKVALTVHDSVVSVIPETNWKEDTQYIIDCMRYVPEWATDVPLDCEAKVGRNYKDMVLFQKLNNLQDLDK